jgi:hypothetical protein
MLDAKSRYYELDTATLVVPDGRMIAYKRRRFVPAPGPVTLVEVTPAEGERLDLVAARTLGDPELYWRLCDANNALSPFDLAQERGRSLRVPLPQP